MPHLQRNESTRNVAVILNLNKDYDRKIAKGISRFAREAGNWTVYLEDDFVNRIPSFQEWNASGVIANLDDEEIYGPLAGIKAPIVGVGGAATISSVSLPVPYLATDNRLIAEIAADHLVERGLRNFAFCGIPAKENDPHTAWSFEREKSFASYLESRGLQCSIYHSVFSHPSHWEIMQRELAGWLAALPKPIGVMACDDPKARHILVACQQSGIVVPDEVSVVGVDNDELMCQMISPELTSVIQNSEQIGYLAARTLDQCISGAACESFKMVSPTGLAVRQSSDAIHVEDPIVADCLRLIRDRLEQDLKVSDIVKYSGYSREMLDIRFRQSIQRTVAGAIQKAKVDRTKEMLLSTNYSLRAIADRLGFSSEQYLVKWFRQITGELPGAFRLARRH
jgi:LacI family transcriptional regulator